VGNRRGPASISTILAVRGSIRLKSRASVCPATFGYGARHLDTGGASAAIWRRTIVIPFPVTIPPEERDRELGARLVQELPAILDWAVQGLRDWRQQGLNPPSRVPQSTKTYRDDNDTIGQWIEAACIVEPRVQATMKELYESYKAWCENSAVEPMQNNSFGKELTRRGFESFRWRSGNGRIGISLKPPASASLKVA
jgi:hypothetical protein